MLSYTTSSLENCMYLKLTYFLYQNLSLFSEKNYKKQVQMFYTIEIFCNLILRNHLAWT